MDSNDRNIWRQVHKVRAIAELECLLQFYLSTEVNEYMKAAEKIDPFIRWLKEGDELG